MQQPNGTGVAAEHLIKEASRVGEVITPDDLGRWHRADLLPRPEPRSRDPGSGSGTVSIYPAIAVRQLLALLQLRKRDDRFESIGWGLWWKLFSVGEQYVRGRLIAAAAELTSARAVFATAYDASETDEGAADAAVDAMMASLHGSHHPPSPLRAEFHRVLLPSLLGVGESPGEEDLRVYKSVLPPSLEPGSLAKGAKRLNLFRELMADVDFSALLKAASPERVNAERDAIRSLVSVVGLRPDRGRGRRPKSDRLRFESPFHPWMVVFMLALDTKGARSEFIESFLRRL